MAEPALRQLDRGLPRIDMRAPSLAARQHEQARPLSAADIQRAKKTALDEIRAEAARLVAEARHEATRLMAVVLADARQQAEALVGGALAKLYAMDAADAAPTPDPKPLVADIIRITAERHGITVRAILGHRRTRHVVAARREAMAAAYVARPDLSLPDLARLFGNRDHTTILAAARAAGVWKKGVR